MSRISRPTHLPPFPSSFALLLWCMCVLSASQSLLSPNLSAAAIDFSFSEEQRDVYLGGYLSLAFSVISIPISQLSGFLTDTVNRRRLLSGFTFLGGMSLVGTACSTTFVHMFIMRAVSGTAFGASVPIAFSLMADMYNKETRASASAALSVSIGAGLLVGSVFAGVTGPLLGWRWPFAVTGFVALINSFAIFMCMEDYLRGSSETLPVEVNPNPNRKADRTLTWSALSSALRVPTNVILVVQAVPNSLAWGLLHTYMNDFLAHERGLSVPQATTLVSAFGIGAAIGAVGGALLGACLYNYSKGSLPLFMGVTSGAAGVAMSLLLQDDSISVSVYYLAFACICGCLAAVNGANIRTLLLNVTMPEARGVVVSLFNTANSLGKGVGPLLLMSAHDGQGRGPAMLRVLSMWSLCGLGFCLTSLTLPTDEDKLEKITRIG